MDEAQIYVPLDEAPRDGDDERPAPAVLIALDRETGAMRWSYSVATRFPPVLTHGVVLVAAPDGIHAVNRRDGQGEWRIAFDRRVRAPMLVRGRLLLAVADDELIAFDIDRHDVAWRRSIGESGSAHMTADDESAFIATAQSRVVRVDLKDGSIAWERPLEGVLSEPKIDRDRLFVGSDADRGSLWSLDAKTGRERWSIRGRFLGGAVVGTASEGDSVYVASKDNFVRALNRGTGNQLWKEAIGTRPLFPPHLFQGIVAVTGSSPILSAFRVKDGTAAGTWAGPSNALLEGPPLMEAPQPFRVNIVVLLRDGRMFGLQSTEMLFKSPPPIPFTALPGRSLPREEPPRTLARD